MSLQCVMSPLTTTIKMYSRFEVSFAPFLLEVVTPLQIFRGHSIKAPSSLPRNEIIWNISPVIKQHSLRTEGLR